MARWSEFATAEPEFAQQVREYFSEDGYGTMATLRRDGSPRISGAYVRFLNGDLLTYAFLGSVRVADLRRDPRLALHCATANNLKKEDHWRGWPGDTKITGYGVETGFDLDLAPGFTLIIFCVDVAEVVHTTDRDEHTLVIESWHEGRGLRRRERGNEPCGR